MTSWDVITPTSIGTGVAKTSLGTQTKPTQAANLIEYVPYQAYTGAATAGESVLTECALESNSINLLPKRNVNSPIQAGLGATFPTLTPMLEAYETNTPLTTGGTEQIQAFGQAMVANTVAVVMGVGLHYSTSSPVRPEMFYTKPDNETSSGTAATSVAGNSVTINGGRTLQKIYPVVTAGTVTASESYIGSMEISSNDFDNSMPIRVPCQPMSVGLSTIIGVLMPKQVIYNNVNMGMKDSATINCTYTQSEALTAAGNFVVGYGYTKV